MLRHPGERLEGESILEELPGDLGVLLWRTSRDVTLWASTPPKARGQLFSEESGDLRLNRLAETEIPEAIAASLDTINGMLTMSHRADADVLAVCCLKVASWARREGLLDTGIAFAQAGAVASPEFAEAALHTGIHAAAARQDVCAETWLRRARGLARRERNRNAYAVSLVELGELYARRADEQRATVVYRQACRAGRRGGVRPVMMRAAHGLLRLARQRGDAAAAAEHAAAAQRACRPNVPGAAEVLLELARFWTDAGEVENARQGLLRLARHRSTLPLTPAGRLAAAALTARAFADSGNDVELGARASADAWALMMDDSIPAPVRLSAAVDLAHAARSSADPMAFARAKRAVLQLAPQEMVAEAVERLAVVWPEEARGIARRLRSERRRRAS